MAKTSGNSGNNDREHLEWHRETDVVIVGSGFAGLAAGLESAAAGAATLILEKRNSFGGNSLIADGALAAAGTKEQVARGIDDSPTLMGADMLRVGLGYNNQTWVDIIAAHSAETLSWLTGDLGCQVDDTIYHFGGHSRARCFNPKGGGLAIVRAMLARYRERGGEAIRRVRFTGFVTDPRGALLGVEVQRQGKRQPEPVERIRVDRAVVLATGGFAGDVAFRSAQDSRLDSSITTTNLPDTTAHALTLAKGIGARTRDLEWIQLAPWTSPDEKGYGVVPLFASYTVFPYGLIVDAVTGRRFVNELAERRVQTDAMLELGQPCIGIADARSMRASTHSIDRCLKSGCVEQFDTLAELAARYGVPTADLHATVERFNDSIENGRDPEFNKPILDGCEPLRAPFVGARLWPKAHYTMGGLAIDRDARVISETGRAIPWLFAAGEVTGGAHGACRLSSTATTECLVQGRIAGFNAATSMGRSRSSLSVSNLPSIP